jgi:hypothetical protein
VEYVPSAIIPALAVAWKPPEFSIPNDFHWRDDTGLSDCGDELRNRIAGDVKVASGGGGHGATLTTAAARPVGAGVVWATC